MDSVPRDQSEERARFRAEFREELEGLGRDLAHLLAARWLKKHHGEQAVLTIEPPAPPTARRRRERKPDPARLAKWEAHWQAEREAES